jgi:hypothetical protein
MRLLRTAAGGFINAEKIIRLVDAQATWVAILGDGEEVALAPYYSAPGRIERDLPHLVARSASAPVAVAGCAFR